MSNISSLIIFFNLEDKKKLFLIIFLFLIGALFESLSVGLILPIFSILIAGKQSLLSSDIFLKFSPDFLITMLQNNSEQTVLFSSLIIITLVYFFKNLYLGGSFYVCYKIIYQLQIDISNNLFKKYLSSPYNFFLNSNRAVLVRNVQDEIGTFVRRLLVPGLLMVSEILTICFLFALLITANPIVSLVASAVSLICGLIIIFFTRKKIKKWGVQRAQFTEKKYKNLFESFNSIIEIKIRNVEQKFFDIFRLNNSKHIFADRNVDLFNIYPRFILEFFGVFLFSCIILTLYSLKFDNSVILPIMALYAAAAFRVLPSVNRILVYYNSFLYGQKAFEKINSEFSNNYSEFSKNIYQLKKSQSEKFNFDRLEFKNVNFSYNENKKILNDINLKIKKGSFTGIKGKSGSGKSTLVLLMTGLLTPDSGDILINDSHNLNSSDINISTFTGYVSQKTTLFDDTIKKNIAIGIDDNDIDKKHLDHVIEITQLKEFINNLKDGLNTIIGDDGLRISGGQRQRIAIARALYFSPELLIMDEATSALDVDIENKIIEILRNLKGKITLIFISHKASNLEICEDKFEVLDNKIKKI